MIAPGRETSPSAKLVIPSDVVAGHDSIEEYTQDVYDRIGPLLEDIHLDVNQPPDYVVGGRLYKSDDVPVSQRLLDDAITKLSTAARERLAETGDADGRFRLKVAKTNEADPQRHQTVRVHAAMYDEGHGITLRIQPSIVPAFADTDLPDRLLEHLNRDRGLFVFAGPVASGKTVAAHSMLRHLNESVLALPKHILCIEDPPEFDHIPIRAKFRVREIGISAPNYVSALAGAMRIRPDHIFLGELRSRDEIKAAVLGASLALPVTTTLHADTSLEALDRLISSFDGNERAEVLAALQGNLAGIVALKRIPSTTGGMITAYEILLNTPATRDGFKDPISLRGALDQQENMNTLETCLMNYHKLGRITKETAIRYAPDTSRLHFDA
jgi:Tfp pilus assembly pilus retraction ATPase PilT